MIALLGGLLLLAASDVPPDWVIAVIDGLDQQHVHLGPMTPAACAQMQQDASQGMPELLIRCVPVQYLPTPKQGGGDYGDDGRRLDATTTAESTAVDGEATHRPRGPS